MLYNSMGQSRTGPLKGKIIRAPIHTPDIICVPHEPSLARFYERVKMMNDVRVYPLMHKMFWFAILLLQVKCFLTDLFAHVSYEFLKH